MRLFLSQNCPKYCYEIGYTSRHSLYKEPQSFISGGALRVGWRGIFASGGKLLSSSPMGSILIA